MRNRRTLWVCLITLGLAFQPLGRRAAPEEEQPGRGEASSPVAPRQGPVQLSPVQRQLIGVTYRTVARRPLIKVIRTVGRVEYDERRLAEVTLKIAGQYQDVRIETDKRSLSL